MQGMCLDILLVFIFRLLIMVTAIEPGCENCGCCVRNVCAEAMVQGALKADFCTYGCIPGIGGNKCYNRCPNDCVTCEQTYSSKCATCEVGMYLSTMKRCQDCPATCTKCQTRTNCQECKATYYSQNPHNDCSKTCPSRCKTCTSSLDCQECVYPYYNQGDSKNCSLSCPGKCVCSTQGLCSGCQDGYFNENNQCNETCPDTCKACSDKNKCTFCIDGYYNGRDGLTNIEVADCSLPCRDTCVNCTALESCIICKQGYYGPHCQNNCSFGCQNGTCNTTDGSCECKDGFTESKCTECSTGIHGERCNQHCPDTCKDIKCRRETGNCFECKSFNITGDTCEKCVHGTWGTQCSSACPKNCEGQCIRESGFCNSCKGNFQGDLCKNCSLGFHGEECNEDCPENCLNSFCYRYNGTCQQCISNYAGPTCEDCSPGMYGQNCDVLCLSLNCSSNICNKNTGRCTSCPNGLYGLQCEFSCSSTCNDSSCEFVSGACSGCKEHYTGDKCCVKGGYCSNCSSSTVCEACDNGFYGEVCNETCPTNCAGQELQCEKANGECLSCKDGFNGDTCNKTCSDRCSNNRCDKDNGHCAEGCAGDYEGPTCTQEKIIPNTNLAPVVGGGAAGFVVIIAICILLVIVIRRRRSHANRREDYKEDKQTGSPQLPGPSPKLIDNKPIYSNDDLDSAELEEDIIEDDSEDIVINIPEGRDAVYENVTNATVSGLEAYVRKKTEEDYKHEFAQLPKGLTQSYNDARKPDNVVKNRYNGVYPYDHSRVKIKGDPKFFMNACFIDGFHRSNMYIASLGPTAKATVEFHTFWTMVWHMDSDVIVMLTNLKEQSGNKCEQYWPNVDCTEVYQDITVSCQSVEVFAEYTVRTYTVEKKSKMRTVHQLHYTAWPDKSIPDEVTSLVEFRQRVRSVPRVHHGPVIIHCSAGIGRTGTYIALDKLTEAGEAGERINFYECVNQMRKQRVNMVQTLEQYEFLHKALVHTLTFQCEAIRVEEFGAYIRDTSDSEFNEKFSLLNTVIEVESSEEIQARNNNGRHGDRNRKHSDIPADRHRPRLYICRSFNSSDYINAMYVNGFQKKDQYIIAQSPLQGTVMDFICLIFQESCYCVVSMEDAALIGTEIGDYLGADNQVLNCGPFTLKASRSETKPNYIMRKLTISNKDKHSSGEKVVYHYQLTNWKRDEKVPADVQLFTQFVKDVSNKADDMKNTKAPILVHCLDGAKRSGLFCAVGILLEKIEAEGQVSVPNTLRRIRTRRKTAIPNKEQFEFCFRSVEVHMNTNNIYTNFTR